ncbi:tRNA (adenosine(37)-N6)-threonylcarbamoyltransferase complex ATPase subunit type 1 TsaE [Acuticoccus sp. I52.16.1]|uniref:tRNA (adenosine(37)-N6)-threonylcarbamoyltransferase complex ATPase subunit type 1 TsaE n=1 Tax=Acuticoccus sp. I52.16.1 TaxID=2928472 RepID=UPI001FD07095|nr:tRNA (adenosine(37)-N6)-threonylcarbamoyltransferase complex ATPase subunit type 1 TsaE [Acuticoccus sp. I52.16.1]UOM35942.1 tRNA (adenosine(37)-N6)-threonylcarbamoyltransferase complex ATPase subunit type 1 TsaE [Acuticoccus sp. I52.16.1]
MTRLAEPPDPDTPVTVAIPIASEDAMLTLGVEIAATLRRGDRVALVGDLGAGKSTLARATLRSLAGDPAFEVPSPTFTIVQDYPELTPPVRHVDLYRVGEGDLAELGLGEGDAAELIEWPREPLPVTVAIAFAADPNARDVTITAPSAWAARLARQRAATAFLARAGWGEARRQPLKTDASTRGYARVTGSATRAVLMDSPVFTPGPGSYPVRARLADGNLGAFLAMGAALRGAGLVAPTAIAVDMTDGFLLMEDFGDDKIAGPDGIYPERYAVAAAALAAFHEAPPELPLAGPPPYRPPMFDADLSAIEVALFPEWYQRAPLDPEYAAMWRAVIEALPRDDDRLALRDFHSPNLMWLSGEEGISRIGFLDYQDAMIAPSAYDMVSLAQDARVDVPDDVEADLVACYLAARPSVDPAQFRRAYHVLGAQRATRVLGVFRRLNDRDGKPQYLAHLPRVRRALAKNLTAEPSLAPLAAWFATHSDVMSA